MNPVMDTGASYKSYKSVTVTFQFKTVLNSKQATSITFEVFEDQMFKWFKCKF